MELIMFEAQWRERASPTTPPRPCQGPSLDQHVLTYIPNLTAPGAGHQRGERERSTPSAMTARFAICLG